MIPANEYEFYMSVKIKLSKVLHNIYDKKYKIYNIQTGSTSLGIPDSIILVPSKQIWVEFKYNTWALRPAQVDWTLRAHESELNGGILSFFKEDNTIKYRSYSMYGSVEDYLSLLKDKSNFTYQDHIYTVDYNKLWGALETEYMGNITKDIKQ